MRFYSILARLALMSLFALQAPSAFTFETDQYSVPPVPLADIGDEVSAYVEQNVIAAMDKLNQEIQVRESCLKQPSQSGCKAPDKEEKVLRELRSREAIAKAVYDRLGRGSLVGTEIGKWFKNHKFAKSPDRFKPAFKDSFYIFMPQDYATLSPTVRIYDSELGWDKIEHVFQQGYDYYTMYNKGLSEGKSREAALQSAVSWGKRTENTYFGMLVSGVYSNGDLFSNLAGMKFYENLTGEVRIGDVRRPAMVVLRDGRWQINPDARLRDMVLRPFISDQMNEALNSSVYAFFVYPTVKRVVTNRDCGDWRRLYPQATEQDWVRRSEPLTNWNGEDYGWKRSSRMFPIARCFAQK